MLGFSKATLLASDLGCFKYVKLVCTLRVANQDLPLEKQTYEAQVLWYARIERNGKVLVVCTDVEHGEQIDTRLVELSRGADLLVHDAQYTAEELKRHRGWGHSSFDQAMQLAEMAGARRLALTHHDPEHDDEFLNASKNCVRNGSQMPCWPAKERKSRSRIQPGFVEKQAGWVDATPSSRSYTQESGGGAASTLLRQLFNKAIQTEANNLETSAQ